MQRIRYAPRMACESILLAWSSGKDGAWALHVLRQDPQVRVAGLLSTVSEVFDRVSMHGVRLDLVRAQARAAGLPLRTVAIPHPYSNSLRRNR